MFFNDIQVYSKFGEEHLEHLGTLSQHQFHANLKKCDIGHIEVRYLGHVISEKAVDLDPQKGASYLGVACSQNN